MASKPAHVAHQFGPFMVSNRRFGKIVAPYFSIGFKTYPVSAAQLDVQLDTPTARMTATRILAGGALLGPAGMILGGLARKDITKGHLTLTIDGRQVQTYEFPARDLDKAVAFIEALATATATTP